MLHEKLDNKKIENLKDFIIFMRYFSGANNKNIYMKLIDFSYKKKPRN